MSDVSSGLDAAMATVGDRWTLLVVDALLDGPLRFSDLQEAIPKVAPNVLSSRLRRLEDQGLVSGARYSDRPPPRRVPRHRSRPRPRRRPPAAEPMGGTRRRGRGRGPPPPIVWHPARGALVLPDLRPGDRAGRRRPPLGLSESSA